VKLPGQEPVLSDENPDLVRRVGEAVLTLLASLNCTTCLRHETLNPYTRPSFDAPYCRSASNITGLTKLFPQDGLHKGEKDKRREFCRSLLEEELVLGSSWEAWNWRRNPCATKRAT
jgi:hypothetical protein